MFGLIRLIALLGAAFVGGVFFERAQAQEGCERQGGGIIDGVCVGAE